MAMNGWTPERRKRQALLIQQWQPWTKATGARTVEGKAQSSRNAYKGGHRAAFRKIMREMNQLLNEQASQLEDYGAGEELLDHTYKK